MAKTPTTDEFDVIVIGSGMGGPVRGRRHRSACVPETEIGNGIRHVTEEHPNISADEAIESA